MSDQTPGAMMDSNMHDMAVRIDNFEEKMAMIEASLSSGATRYNTVKDLLKAVPSKDGQIFETISHTVEGFGGGLYQYKAKDTKSAHDGGDMLVTAKGHRLKRLWGATPIGNVMAWGADPTGKIPCSDILQAMVDSNKVRCIILPGEGTFVGDKTVEMTKLESNGKRDRNHKLRIPIKGDMYSHFANYKDKASFSLAKGFNGPLLRDAMYIENVAFFGHGRTAQGDTVKLVEIEGYNDHYLGCGFFDADLGLYTESFGTNVIVERCHFYRVSFCFSSWDTKGGSLSTTHSFVRNLCQGCGIFAFVTGQINGHTYEDNTWEDCDSHFAVGREIYKSAFRNNWIEKGGRGFQPKQADGKTLKYGEKHKFERAFQKHSNCPTLRSLGNQQIMDCISENNKVVFGTWANTFNPDCSKGEQHNDQMAGVDLSGQVKVSGSTGDATVLSKRAIDFFPDDWTSGNTPFLIKVRGNKNGKIPFRVEARGDIELQTETGVFNFIDASSWREQPAKLAFKMTRVGDMHAAIRVPHSTLAKDGKSAKQDKFGEQRSVMMLPLRWEGGWDNGKAPSDYGYFDRSYVDKDKGVYLINDYLELRSPMFTVTCHDEGISYSHCDYVNSYGSSYKTYKICKGLKLYFKDKDGKLVEPKCFDLLLHNRA